MPSERLIPDFHRVDSLPTDTVARVRYQRHAPVLVRLGPRVVAELLLEARALMSPRRREHFDGRVKIHAEISPDILAATGGDKIPVPPIRVVTNRGR